MDKRHPTPILQWFMRYIPPQPVNILSTLLSTAYFSHYFHQLTLHSLSPTHFWNPQFRQFSKPWFPRGSPFPGQIGHGLLQHKHMVCLQNPESETNFQLIFPPRFWSESQALSIWMSHWRTVCPKPEGRGDMEVISSWLSSSSEQSQRAARKPEAFTFKMCCKPERRF